MRASRPPSTATLETTQGNLFTRAGADLTDVKFGSTAIADLDGDGVSDLVVTGEKESNALIATVYLGQGDGSFTEHTSAGLTGVYYGSASIADLNGDNIPDLVTTGYDAAQNPTATVYLGNGDGSFTEQADPGLQETHFSSTAIADLDGDDVPDLILTGRNGPDQFANVYLGNGDGSFTEKTNADLKGIDLGSLSVADLNGDNIPDAVLTGYVSSGNQTTAVYLGDGDGSFTEKPEAGLIGVGHYSSLSIADLDGDTTLDIVITGEDASYSHRTAVYLGNGDGTFTVLDAGLPNVQSGSTDIADLNGDSTSDLVLTGRDASGNVMADVYLGNGNGTFSVAGANLTGVAGSSASIADFNTDTIPDLVVTGQDASGNSTSTMYIGNGDGTFARTTVGLPGIVEGSTTVADFDGDGRPDLALAGRDASNAPITLVYENLGDDPLPVELVQFDAQRTGHDVTLTWSTASETNNAGFEVQHHGPDANTFVQTGFIEGHGTTNRPKTYQFNLSDLSVGRHRFRLRQMDLDGTSTLSETVELYVGPATPFVLDAPYPNPVTDSATLKLTVRQSQVVQVVMYNVLGQRVATLHNATVNAEEPLILPINSRPLSVGAYFVHVNGERFQATRRLTVVR